MSAVRGRAERVVFSLPRIKRETFVRTAELHRSIDSTNRRAMELAAIDQTLLPALVLAENQTAGKGRGPNVWWSAPGALTFSLLLDLADQKTSPESWPRFALAAAVAVSQSLEAAAPGVSFGIRWPNDVCCDRRKICGVLPELYLAPNPRLVLGIGINANNSVEGAPPDLKESAVSILELTGRRTNLTNLVIDVMRRLEVRLRELATSAPELPRAWSERCLLRGHTIRLKVDTDEFEGQCEGIDENGALLLCTSSKTRRYYGGTIVSIVY